MSGKSLPTHNTKTLTQRVCDVLEKQQAPVWPAQKEMRRGIRDKIREPGGGCGPCKAWEAIVSILL